MRRITHATALVATVGLGLILMLGTSHSSAGEKKPASPNNKPAAKKKAAPSDLTAIRAGSQAFVAAFNKRDSAAVAALWTKDGDYTDSSGQVFSGREAIQKEYASFFKQNPRAKLRLALDSLRMLSDHAAIEDGRAMLDPAAPGVPAVSNYTAIHVKVDGKWYLSTVRDARQETPSAYRKVADLEWLIGSWAGEERGVKSVSECRWVANKSFVERTYTVTHPDQTETSGIQLIGFNPRGGHIQSWSFTSDGGHAIGVWSARRGGWQAEVRGLTGSGVATSAVNLLTRLDDNAYAWQSVRRSAGGTALADTGEVIIRRASGK